MQSQIAQKKEFLRQVHGLYSQGYFPMGADQGELEWYSTRYRALFPIEGMRVSHSLEKFLKKCDWEVTFDQAFEQTIRACLRPDDNWITEELIDWYLAIFEDGWAHSCEVWDGEELVGGVYGLAIGRCFNAESMFHRATNGSKVALHHLIQKCREEGFEIFDAQIMNPHLASLGAFEVPQIQYLNSLALVSNQKIPWSRSRSGAF